MQITKLTHMCLMQCELTPCCFVARGSNAVKSVCQYAMFCGQDGFRSLKRDFVVIWFQMLLIKF